MAVDAGHDDALVGLNSRDQVYPIIARWLSTPSRPAATSREPAWGSDGLRPIGSRRGLPLHRLDLPPAVLPPVRILPAAGADLCG